MAELQPGVLGILLTSYDEDGRVHHRDLEAQADFVASTAQGVVWPVMASEFQLMSQEEVAAGFSPIARGIAGRVPFVAGVTRLTAAEAVDLARAAAEAGAGAVIAMPPFASSVHGAHLVDHFRAIAAVGLPVVVQNQMSMGPGGPITIDELRRLAEEIPGVQYLKEEAPALPQTISRALAALPGLYRLVFGGAGGRFLIDELNRGGAGTMPACEWADLVAEVWRLHHGGDEAAARALHAQALPGILLETAYGMVGAREVLFRRGVIRSTRGRLGAGAELDDAARREIEATLAQVWDRLPWRAGTPG